MRSPRLAFLELCEEPSFLRVFVVSSSVSCDQPFHALEYEGTTYDCGDKVGWLRANVAMALKRPDMADAVRAALAPLLS